ncbi:MAG: MoxR family ATPase [Acidobacteria bacterium]|nr:MoxR family ATPase [Acidobacteriota bacterium]
MREKVEQAGATLQEVRREMGRGVVGQAIMVDGLLWGVLANGHVLIEGVPGLAKTRAVNLLARMSQSVFKRIQFTPDLLPADIVGNRIYNHARGSFETKTGPIFANFILADEINRAPAKVQSALLEAMQERQVTIGEETFPLPVPFFVFATQNPIEQEGTYPLPEAQVDRFIVKLRVDYPTPEEEVRIVKMVMNETELPAVRPLLSAETILALQAEVRAVYVDERLIRYATDLVWATRDGRRHDLPFDNLIEYGASPRASIAMIQVGRACAFLDQRDAVTPDDIKSVAPGVLRHRIIPTYHAQAEGITSEQLVAEVLQKVKVP